MFNPAAARERCEAATVAQAFHEAYEELASEFGYKTREASAVPWADVPEGNKALMIATAERVMQAIDLPAALEALEEAQGKLKAIGADLHLFDAHLAEAHDHECGICIVRNIRGILSEEGE